MGVASLIIGIVSLMISFIPICGYFSLIPATVGIILGAVAYSKDPKSEEPKGQALAGLILNIVTIGVLLTWTILIIFGDNIDPEEMKHMQIKLQENMEEKAANKTDDNNA
ncbi:DUF4190 domain-containing protein [Lentisphaerota bacterium WC36G]|nr:DUF4190 domain-containing protein [Lentisphaerae bacterium WC36]